MTYITYFSMASALYLLVTMHFYNLQRKPPSRRQTLYQLLLFTGLITLLFDIISARMDAVASSYPHLLYGAVNFVFLLATQSAGPLFFFYTLVLSGVYPSIRRGTKLAYLLPLGVTTVLLALSLINSPVGIFYLDANNVYHRGTTYMLLYATMAFYLIGGTAAVTMHRRAIQRKKLYTVYAFILLCFVAMMIQVSLPMMLVNCTANALALTMMYYALQPPEENIDPLTGAFNRSALYSLLCDLSEQNQSYGVMLFPVMSIRAVNLGMGVKAGDDLLRRFTECLRKAFPKKYVIRVHGNVLATIDTDQLAPYTEADLQNARSTLRAVLEAEGLCDQRIFAAGINAGIGDSAQDIIGLMDYIIAEYHPADGVDTMLADKESKEDLSYRARVEAAVEHALNSNSLEVYYQPIHSADGRLSGLEALCRINDDELGFISPELFIRIAEMNGSIHRVGDVVLRQTCAFVRDNIALMGSLGHVGVNLSVAQCMRDDLAESIIEIVDQYNIPHSLLSFEITETEAVKGIPAVRKNMDDLRGAGFSFMLDDFGSGYANFDYLTLYPFSCVKIDKQILWKSSDSEVYMALLRGMCRMAARLNMKILCEGVETADQVSLLRSLNTDLMQGYYYSKPLSPVKLLEYLGCAEAFEGVRE